MVRPARMADRADEGATGAQEEATSDAQPVRGATAPRQGP